MDIVHIPVLLEEIIGYLAPRKKGELMVDATLGEGGHSYAFLSRFPDLRLIGIDADADIQKAARERLGEFGDRARFYTGWAHDFFARAVSGATGVEGGMPDVVSGMTVRPDTILIDLGVSSYHYEKSGRGFSFRKDEPLDMRIGTGRGPAAAELIARIPERELADMLYRNAGERYSRRIARAIVEGRGRGAIGSSLALAEIVRAAVPRPGRGTHPATRVFQAVRIAVNKELEMLPELLEKAFEALKPGGRLGVISFHSGEDRIVKNFFRDRSREFRASGENPSCGRVEEPIVKDEGQRVLKLLTRKPVVPGEGEIRNNPPSRSAKFRAVEKLSGA
ncbi:MAG: 16S rRNA (cytosine(1402)-N(4))-methyltransferase RsmH [Treponema sp.]|jgi:16S rRNA (cytosine1402-N4)-methyltransferase|nr:16S rRNA (cytosine(1402)-N(4))-methyltransferase RsmH [Treponema sp.]